jgi:hypothetical protein
MEDQQKVYDPMQDDDPMQDSESDEQSGETAGTDAEATEEPTGNPKVIYEGECRSDNRNTISDNGEVITSYRTLALPIKQDEWTEETIPLEGDRIELQRFGYKEYGLVIDKRPSNLGTHILWRYVRN